MKCQNNLYLRTLISIIDIVNKIFLTIKSHDCYILYISSQKALCLHLRRIDLNVEIFLVYINPQMRKSK